MAEEGEIELNDDEYCMHIFGPDYPELVDTLNKFQIEHGEWHGVSLYEENVDLDDALLDVIHERFGDRLELHHATPDIIDCARKILQQPNFYERLLGEEIFAELVEGANEYVGEHITGGPFRKRELLKDIKDLVRERVFPGGSLPREWNKPVDKVVNEIYKTVEEDETFEKFRARNAPERTGTKPSSPLRIIEVSDKSAVQAQQLLSRPKKSSTKNLVKALFSRQKLGRGQKTRRGKTRRKGKSKKAKRQGRTRRRRYPRSAE